VVVEFLRQGNRVLREGDLVGKTLEDGILGGAILEGRRDLGVIEVDEDRPLLGLVKRAGRLRALIVELDREATTRTTLALASVSAGATGSRRFTPARAGATFSRDRFHCRYCGGRVIPVALMSLLSHLYPEQLPYVYTYKDVHAVYWTRGAEADHIKPGSKGGDWEDPGNLATACVRCNTAKSDHSARGDRLANPGRSTSDWDGLTGWYRPLWERADEPNPDYHLSWIRAFADGKH